MDFLSNLLQTTLHLNKVIPGWNDVDEPESLWDKVEREEDNAERFALGLHGYDEFGNVIEPITNEVWDLNALPLFSDGTEAPDISDWFNE